MWWSVQPHCPVALPSREVCPVSIGKEVGWAQNRTRLFGEDLKCLASVSSRTTIAWLFSLHRQRYLVPLDEEVDGFIEGHTGRCTGREVSGLMGRDRALELDV
jgi:hypothetical protein